MCDSLFKVSGWDTCETQVKVKFLLTEREPGFSEGKVKDHRPKKQV